MDFSLRCNSLKCRRQLDGRAVVTTCSHIFCVQCSDSLGLSNVPSENRICPACQTRLSNADDAVATQLNPPEDYKTSVLSGLSPSIIMECAGRGLAFFSYQASQEIIYQEFLAKNLTDKYAVLSGQMDQIINDANNEIINLRNKITAAQQERETLQRNNDDLKQSLKHKTMALHKTQQMYDDAKKRLLQSDVQSAAADAVEDTLAAVTLESYDDARGNTSRNMRQPPILFEQRGQQRTQDRHRRSGSGSDESIRQSHMDGRAIYGQSWRSNGPAAVTTTEQRTRLPVATPHSTRHRRVDDLSGVTNIFNAGSSQQTPMGRPALRPLNNNSVGNSIASSYGLSAGVKAGRMLNGRSQVSSLNRSGIPTLQ